MKKGFLHTELIIDTKRHYPMQELFEMVKERFGDKYDKIYTNKELKLVETIFIESVDGYVNIMPQKWGFSGKGRITIGIEKPFKKLFKITGRDVLFVVLCFVTLGLLFFIRIFVDFLRGIFNLEGTRKNRAMMKSIANEINQMVEK